MEVLLPFIARMKTNIHQDWESLRTLLQNRGPEIPHILHSPAGVRKFSLRYKYSKTKKSSNFPTGGRKWARKLETRSGASILGIELAVVAAYTCNGVQSA